MHLNDAVEHIQVELRALKAVLYKVRTINSELNGASEASEVVIDPGRASVKIWGKLTFKINFLRQVGFFFRFRLKFDSSASVAASEV